MGREAASAFPAVCGEEECAEGRWTGRRAAAGGPAGASAQNPGPQEPPGARPGRAASRGVQTSWPASGSASRSPGRGRGAVGAGGGRPGVGRGFGLAGRPPCLCPCGARVSGAPTLRPGVATQEPRSGARLRRPSCKQSHTQRGKLRHGAGTVSVLLRESGAELGVEAGSTEGGRAAPVPREGWGQEGGASGAGVCAARVCRKPTQLDSRPRNGGGTWLPPPRGLCVPACPLAWSPHRLWLLWAQRSGLALGAADAVTGNVCARALVGDGCALMGTVSCFVQLPSGLWSRH